MPAEDENSSRPLEHAFRKRGIKFNLGTFFSKAEYTADGVKVTLADGKEFQAEVLLVAVGRDPVSQGLGYEGHGVAMDRDYVLVDEYMQTNVPDHLGRRRPGPHAPTRTRRLRRGHPRRGSRPALKVVPINDDGVPRVTFCHPEVASVGITEARAKEVHGADKVVSIHLPAAATARARS